jgi:hypothetical protein
VHWECFVCWAQPGNQMIFEWSNISFCCIPSMTVWRYQLEVDFLFMQGCFEQLWHLIVKSHKFWLEASWGQFSLHDFKSLNSSAAVLFLMVFAIMTLPSYSYKSMMYVFPLLETTEKHPVWSVYICPALIVAAYVQFVYLRTIMPHPPNKPTTIT